jgi:hypothetical protein
MTFNQPLQAALAKYNAAAKEPSTSIVSNGAGNMSAAKIDWTEAAWRDRERITRAMASTKALKAGNRRE